MAMGLTPGRPNGASSTGAGEERQMSSASTCAGHALAKMLCLAILVESLGALYLWNL